MAERRAYIYKLTNIKNGKVYIGKTLRPETRFIKHRSAAKCGLPGLINEAIRKHGEENFSYKVIVSCFNDSDGYAYEKLLVAQYDSTNRANGYNRQSGGIGPTSEDQKRILNSFPPEVRKSWTKNALIAKKVWHDNLSPEEKAAHYRKVQEGTIKAGKKEGVIAAMRAGLKPEHRSKGAKARFAKLTPEEKHAFSSKGAKACYDSLSDEQKKIKIAKLVAGHVENVRKPVRCIETGETFPSQSEAARQLKMSQSCIWAVLVGRKKSAKGLTFEHVPK